MVDAECLVSCGGRGVASFNFRFSSPDLEQKAWVQTGGYWRV